MDNISEVKQPLSFGQKVAWSIGGMADTLMSNVLFSLAIPIYCIGMGVDPFLIGIALALPRLWDAVTDPVMGNISDNTRSRFGRRKPYIICGTIVASILFCLIWNPPGFLNEIGLFIFFTVVSISFFTAYTVFAVPWNALGFELTTDYNERTKVMAYKGFLASLACALILPLPYKLSLLPVFGNDEVEGIKIVGLMFAAVMLVLGIIPGIFCKEVAKENTQKQEKIKLLTAIKETSQNRPFLLICGVIICVITGVYLLMPLGSYLMIYYLYDGVKSDAATLMMLGQFVYNGLGLAIMPAIVWASKKFGKRITLMVGLSLVVLAYPLTLITYNKDYPYLVLVGSFLTCPGLSCVWVLTSSMLADVCDLDELKTGLRREGMYGGIFTWVFKLGLTVAMAVSGLVVRYSGFDQDLSPLENSDALWFMRLCNAAVPTMFMLTALICAFYYPLTRAKMKEVREQLDSRKKE
ncbi:MAG: MFS transporter [Sedimentisphaeraceae bacterium JB056]